MRSTHPRLLAAALAVLAATAAHGGADDKVLRVCADPNNLPLSHRNEQGYENRIAALFAQDLGWKLEYAWFPQRMGFIRNTLRGRDPGAEHFRCDLVLGVPDGFELASTTKPYYRSTYAMVYVRGGALDTVAKPDDVLALAPDTLKRLRFGVFAQTPPADWLVRHNLFDQAVSYTRQSGDPDETPAAMVERDLAAGKLDIAFVWGPIAGYAARHVPDARLAVVPFPPQPDIRFDYAIAMGVRFGEREWKARVQQFLDARRAGIEQILMDYGVPLLDESGRFIQTKAAATGR